MIVILLLILFSFSFAQDTLIRWEEEVNLTQDTVYNLYPWIECQDNYVHIVWAELDNGVYYQRSTDSGTTWSEPFRLHTDTTVIIHPKLALGGEKVYCIWDAGYAGRWQLWFTRSTDSGATWDSIVVLDDSVYCKATIAASGDTVFIVEHMPDTIFQLRRSFDGGVNWSSPYLINKMMPLYYPGLFYLDNILHLAFVNYDAGQAVYYMYSTDLGEIWSDSIQIAINPDAPKCRNIVANDYGYLFVPWSDNKYSGGALDDILLRRSPDTGLTWLPEQQITNHHLARSWDDICCADSDVYLVWAKGGSEDALQFRASTDMGETWWQIENLCNNLLFDGTIASDSSKIHIAWRDRRDFPSEIYYRQGTRLPVGIEESALHSMPDALRLRVYPNPFSKLTTINFGKELSAWRKEEKTISSKPLTFSVKIYDVSGKKVVVLGHQNIRESGYQGNQVVWNGRDKNELQVPAGVYFVQVKAGNECIIKKVVKLK
ncbi:MAG: T9SS type A sorting domain-containing protein [bacterium]